MLRVMQSRFATTVELDSDLVLVDVKGVAIMKESGVDSAGLDTDDSKELILLDIREKLRALNLSTTELVHFSILDRKKGRVKLLCTRSMQKQLRKVNYNLDQKKLATGLLYMNVSGMQSWFEQTRVVQLCLRQSMQAGVVVIAETHLDAKTEKDLANVCMDVKLQGFTASRSFASYDRAHVFKRKKEQAKAKEIASNKARDKDVFSVSGEDTGDSEKEGGVESERKSGTEDVVASGGVAVMVADFYGRGERITTNGLVTDGVLWVKVIRKALPDLYVCAVYVPHKASVFQHEIDAIWEAVSLGAAMFKEQGEVIIVGDFNARTANLPSRGDEFHYDRKSDDNREPDSAGLSLMAHAQHGELVVLNGTSIRGERHFGGYTNRRTSGSSTVDYVLVPERQVASFGVLSRMEDGRRVIGYDNEHEMLAIQIPHEGEESIRAFKGTERKKCVVERRGVEWKPIQRAVGSALRKWLRQHRVTKQRAEGERPAGRGNDSDGSSDYDSEDESDGECSHQEGHVHMHSQSHPHSPSQSHSRSHVHVLDENQMHEGAESETDEGQHTHKQVGDQASMEVLFENFVGHVYGVTDALQSQAEAAMPGVEVLDNDIARLYEQRREMGGLDPKARGVSKKIKRLIARRRRKAEETMLARLDKVRGDSKQLWSLLKSFYFLHGVRPRPFGEKGVLDNKKKVVQGAEIGSVVEQFFARIGAKNADDDVKFNSARKEQIEIAMKAIREGDVPPIEFDDMLDSQIRRQEVQDVLKRAKADKACGLDGLCIELFQGSRASCDALWYLLSECWRRKRVPGEWMRGIIILLHKNGDVRDLDNFRGITLLSAVHRLYTAVLQARLSRYCEEKGIIADEQAAFRQHRGVRDHLFVLSEIIRVRMEKKKPTYACFVDLRKAFDRVDRNELFARLWEVGIRGHMLYVLLHMYNEVESCVSINGQLTERFQYECGVRQGCMLSPTLFAIFMDGVVRHIDGQCSKDGIKVGNRYVRILLYADDIVLLGENATMLQRLMNELGEHACGARYEISQKKTQVLVFGEEQWRRDKKREWNIRGLKINEVEVYKYLGVVFDKKLSFKEEMRAKELRMRSNLSILKSVGRRGGQANFKDMELIYQSHIMGVIDQSAIIWQRRACEQLAATQRIAWRFMLGVGPKTPDLAIQGDLGFFTLQGTVELQRLRWWSVIEQMGEDKLVKCVYRWGKESESWWWLYTKEVMESVEIGDNEWSLSADKMREKMHAREQKRWVDAVSTDKGVKMASYRGSCGKFLQRARYLEDNSVRRMRGVVTELRAGCAKLVAVETGRWAKVARAQRLCPHCDAQAVETEQHCLVECAAWAVERKQVIDKYCELKIGNYAVEPTQAEQHELALAMLCWGQEVDALEFNVFCQWSKSVRIYLQRVESSKVKQSKGPKREAKKKEEKQGRKMKQKKKLNANERKKLRREKIVRDASKRLIAMQSAKEKQEEKVRGEIEKERDRVKENGKEKGKEKNRRKAKVNEESKEKESEEKMVKEVWRQKSQSEKEKSRVEEQKQSREARAAARGMRLVSQNEQAAAAEERMRQMLAGDGLIA